ncbi:MAG: hypothetical protein U9R03_01360 [Candidatus Aerophobetes bacterium]|nr:hypothetical protein [Candidatus Aerophobetes bacterium]
MNEELKAKLTTIVKDDPYGLREETLYKNILYSTGTDEKLSELFNVPIEIIREIKSHKK